MGDEVTAHARYAAALPLLRAAAGDPGAMAPTLAAWAPVAAGLGDTDALMTHLDTLLSSDGSHEALLDSDLEERQRRQSENLQASLLETWARVVASRSPGVDGQIDGQVAGQSARDAADAATRAGELFAQVGRIGSAAQAFWLAGQILREDGDLDGAVLALSLIHI